MKKRVAKKKKSRVIRKSSNLDTFLKILIILIVLALTILGILYTQNIIQFGPADNLVAWYKLDNNANDASGHNYNGAGTGVSYASGKITQAASFDGASSVVNIPMTGLLKNPGDKLTIASWVKTDNFNGEEKWVIAQEDNAYQMSIKNNQLYCYVKDSGAQRGSSLALSNLTVNFWHHFACVFDYTTRLITYYEDGTSLGTTDIGGSKTSIYNESDKAITLGAKPNSYPTLSIDDLRIYNSALTSTEIIQVMNYVPCLPETDTAFCSRLGKNCSSVTALDNCQVSRTANCGTCASGTCTNNVCVLPSCTPDNSACSNKNCGSVSNGTCGTISCGTCASGYSCNSSNNCYSNPNPSQNCSDGTINNSCSTTKPLYCNSSLNLVNNCTGCGCSSGVCNITLNICNVNTCTANWTAQLNPCRTDETQVRWYNDSNVCNDNTNMPGNTTLDCDYNGNGIIGNTTIFSVMNINSSIYLNSELINLSKVYNTEKTIEIKDSAGTTRVKFTYDFSQPLNFKNIVIKKQTSSNYGYLIVQGISQAKVLTINKLNSTSNKVCAKNAYTEDIGYLSTNCNSANEYLVDCPGNYSQFQCNVSGDFYIVSGLTNSGVKEYIISSPNSGCTPLWNCSSWSVCANIIQTRTCQDSHSCGTTFSRPNLNQTCTILPPVPSCTANWQCSSWAACSEDGTQTRTCTDSNSCNLPLPASKPLSQSCTYKKNNNSFWTIMIIVLSILIIGVAIVILYLIKKNKAPKRVNLLQQPRIINNQPPRY